MRLLLLNAYIGYCDYGKRMGLNFLGSWICSSELPVDFWEGIKQGNRWKCVGHDQAN